MAETDTDDDQSTRSEWRTRKSIHRESSFSRHLPPRIRPNWDIFGVELRAALASNDPSAVRKVFELLVKESSTHEQFNILHRAYQYLGSLTTKVTPSVYVVGESKSGKSTLMNAILGLRACPVKARPETIHLTYFSSGKSWEIVVDNQPQPSSKKDFEAHLGGVIERGKRDTGKTKTVKARIPSNECAPLLKRARFVDTPGVTESCFLDAVSKAILKDKVAIVACLVPLIGDSMVKDKLGPVRFLDAFRTSVGALSPLLFVFTKLNEHYRDIRRAHGRGREEDWMEECTEDVKALRDDLQSSFPGAYCTFADCNSEAEVMWSSNKDMVVKKPGHLVQSFGTSSSACTTRNSGGRSHDRSGARSRRRSSSPEIQGIKQQPIDYNPLEDFSAILTKIIGETKTVCWCVGPAKSNKLEFVSDLAGAKLTWDQKDEKIIIEGSYENDFHLLRNNNTMIKATNAAILPPEGWATLQVPIEKAPNLKYLKIIDTSPSLPCDKLKVRPQDWLVVVLPLDNHDVSEAIFAQYYEVRARKLFVLTRLSKLYKQAKKKNGESDSLLRDLSELIGLLLAKLESCCPESKHFFFDTKTDVFWDGKAVSTVKPRTPTNLVSSCVGLFREKNAETIRREAVHALLPISFVLFKDSTLEEPLRQFDRHSGHARESVRQNWKRYLETLPEKIQAAFQKAKLRPLLDEKKEIQSGGQPNSDSLSDIEQDIKVCKSLRRENDDEELPGHRGGLKQFQRKLCMFVREELHCSSIDELIRAYEPLKKFCQDFAVDFNQEWGRELSSVLTGTESADRSGILAGVLAVGAGAGAGVGAGGVAAGAALGVGAAIGIGFAVALPVMAILATAGYVTYQRAWTYDGQVDDMEEHFQKTIAKMQGIQLQHSEDRLKLFIEKARYNFVLNELDKVTLPPNSPPSSD